MTIGIDIRVLTRGNRTGVEEYAINLLSRLLKLDTGIKYKLFFNAYNKVGLDYDWLGLPNVKLFEFKIPNRLLFISSKYLKYPKIDKVLGGVDILLAPHFFNAQVSRGCKKVVTFHDLSFEYLPEVSSWRRKFWQRRLLDIKGEAAGADRIISVSESTRQDLINLYKIDQEKIKTIYLGVGEEFQKLKVDSSVGGEKLKIKEKYRLPDKFVLYLGTIEPRKNIIGLIRAFELLKDKNSDLADLWLVIAGVKGWLYDEIFEEAKKSKYSGRILFTGFIEPADKVYLYNLASLFVYPSLFEGFGFPPLEAMACGVPVITSNISSLPEIVGNAGLMIDPYNISELAWAMEEVLSDAVLREELASRGLERARIFSWDKCAGETLSLITSLI